MSIGYGWTGTVFSIIFFWGAAALFMERVVFLPHLALMLKSVLIVAGIETATNILTLCFKASEALIEEIKE